MPVAKMKEMSIRRQQDAHNKYLDRCSAIMAVAPEKVCEFIGSVKESIDVFPERYPTAKQAFWIDKYYDHYAMMDDGPVVPCSYNSGLVRFGDMAE